MAMGAGMNFRVIAVMIAVRCSRTRFRLRTLNPNSSSQDPQVQQAEVTQTERRVFAKAFCVYSTLDVRQKQQQERQISRRRWEMTRCVDPTTP